MNFLTLLAGMSSASEVISSEISLNFIGKYIQWLIGITGSTGLGIILFTLTLRLIVLPFDIISKVKMKKNAIKMEKMRPELERLQKQYANDKNLYNQKMMALQKKNGYSVLSGCLPSILSLIIFFVAIDAFRMYSAFAMNEEYNEIVKTYNSLVKINTVESAASDMYEITEDGNNFVISLKTDAHYENRENLKKVVKPEGDHYVLNIDSSKRFTAEASEFIDSVIESLSTESASRLEKKEGESVYTFVAKNSDDEGTSEQNQNKELAESLISIVSDDYLEKNVTVKVNEGVKEAYTKGNIKQSSFLWVKNIWMPDVSYEHPIPATVEKFKEKISAAARRSCSCDNVTIEIDGIQYDMVTAGLADQKTSPNGYFIMVALSILTTFLSQFVMQKMQKSQLELQSVDGQAAMTQKMMTWMMPIMFGVFAFSYSTAFSIYMTVSSIVTTVSSVLINLILEKKYDNAPESVVSRSKGNINKIEKEVEKKQAEEEQKRLEKNKKKSDK